MAEDTPEVKDETPKKRAPRKDTEKATDPSGTGQVVGDGDTDPVYLREIVYRNIKKRKSLSVHHLQRRLNDLGYAEAYADPDGFYGDLTMGAVARYQREHNLTETGMVDADTFNTIFKGDANVDLHVI
jgi:hypothetical protein